MFFTSSLLKTPTKPATLVYSVLALFLRALYMFSISCSLSMQLLLLLF